MSILWKNTEMKTIIYNGKTMDKVYFNNVLVYQRKMSLLDKNTNYVIPGAVITLNQPLDEQLGEVIWKNGYPEQIYGWATYISPQIDFTPYKTMYFVGEVDANTDHHVHFYFSQGNKGDWFGADWDPTISEAGNAELYYPHVYTYSNPIAIDCSRVNRSGYFKIHVPNPVSIRPVELWLE